MSASDEIASLSAVDLAAHYKSGDLTPLEAAQAIFERIKRLNPVYNAFAFIDESSTLEDARRSTERWRKGEPLSPIDGVPATLKDLLWVKGWPTLRGSLAIDPKQPWTEDSPAAARLRERGVIFLGKTTTSEFGWKGLGDSPLTGITRNPWDHTRTSGGSSAGAAAGAALGFGPFHVGTDGGGSIRLPAAFTGNVGFKPTFGRVPGYPSAHTGTLFHVGTLTRTVDDNALLFNAIARPDPRDWNALPADNRDWTRELLGEVKGLKIAYSPTLGYGDVDPEIAASVASSVKVFSDLGAHVEEIDPGLADPQSIFQTLWSAGAARLIFGLPEHERKLVEPGLQAVAEQGRAIAVTDYVLAAEAREALGRQLGIFHGTWDLLMTPTNAAPPDLAEAPPGRRPARSPFTFPFNLTQQPAISVPCGLTVTGLPIGLQIVGPKYADGLVLRAARAFERVRPFARLKEPA